METKVIKDDKRQQLRELSKIAKLRMQADCEGMTVNEILIEEFYTNEENTIFKTLREWSKEGYKVKKGEKAFLIWGKPRAINKKEAQQPKEDEEKEDFYPICFIFSNAQVVKRC